MRFGFAWLTESDCVVMSLLVKIVTAAVFREDDRILIARRGSNSSLSGKWEFPGGKVEEFESLGECLRREIYEEFGVQISVGSRLCSSEFSYDHGSFRIEAFWVERISGEFKLTVHDRIEWVPVGDLQTYELLPADVPIAEAVAALCIQ